jgi:hypothetical protein
VVPGTAAASSTAAAATSTATAALPARRASIWAPWREVVMTKRGSARATRSHSNAKLAGMAHARQVDRQHDGQPADDDLNAGHVSNLERPDEFNEAVREFCRAHSPRFACGAD